MPLFAAGATFFFFGSPFPNCREVEFKLSSSYPYGAISGPTNSRYLFSSSPAASRGTAAAFFICLFFFLPTLFLNFSAAALPHLAARLLLFICLFCSTLFLNFSAPALPHLLVAISSPCRFFAAGLVIPRHLYAKGGIFRLFFLQNNSPPDFRVWTACAWHLHTRLLSDRLESVQRRATRVILKERRQEMSYQNRLQQLNWQITRNQKKIFLINICHKSFVWCC